MRVWKMYGIAIVGLLILGVVVGIVESDQQITWAGRQERSGPVVGNADAIVAFWSCDAPRDASGVVLEPRFFQSAAIMTTDEGKAIEVMYCLFGRPRDAHLADVYREIRSHRYGDRLAAEFHPRQRPLLQYRMYRTLARLWGVRHEMFMSGQDIDPATQPLVFVDQHHRRSLHQAGAEHIVMELEGSEFVIHLR